jgi:alkylation response protein AidB-like acyl-CoA dehydrogenase
MRSLDGFLPGDHLLSTGRAFERLDPKVRALVTYEPQALWELDTAALPKALGEYRRRMRDFAQSVLRPHALELDCDTHGPKSMEILAEAARQGLLSDLLPAPFGTLPLRLATRPPQLVLSIKMEELCAACAGLGIMICVHALGTMPLLLTGNVSTIFRHVISANKANRKGAERLYAFAITEPGGGSDVEDNEGAAAYRPQTTAKQANGGWIINGRKVFITGGDLAHGATVFAALEGEGMESWTCFLIEKSMKGFQVGRNELKMGQRAVAATELIFDDVFVPDSHLIGGLRNGWALNRAVLSFSRIPVGAIALGIARGAMESAIEFACRTTMAGKALVNYQEIQLQIAQMMIDTAAMRSMIWQAAGTWKPNQARASMTKVFCSDTAVAVCESAMELLGAHGFLKGNSVEKNYRDARVTQIYEGTNQINRLAVIEDQASWLLEKCENMGGNDNG